MELEYEIIKLGRILSDCNDAGSDLWSWLPSYRKAKKCLGGYASNVRPCNADVMREACSFIADACNPSEEHMNSYYLYQCPCGGDCPRVPTDDFPGEGLAKVQDWSMMAK